MKAISVKIKTPFTWEEGNRKDRQKECLDFFPCCLLGKKQNWRMKF